MRWQDPSRGLILPGEFIPVAENNEKLIESLTNVVLEKVLRYDMVRIDGIQKLNISINLSAKMLNNLSLPDEVANLLATYKYEPNRLMM